MKFISSDKVIKSEAFIDWKQGKTVKPQVVELHVSNRCNNACFYCSMKNVKDAKIMTDEEIGKSLDFIKAIGGKAVTFSGGGEPFCNTDFLSNLAYATAALDLEAGVITNGVLLTKGMAEMVLSLPKVKWIRISFDAITPEIYKNIRGVDTFEIVRKNIKDLLEVKKESGAKTTVGIQIVVNEYNYKTILKFVEFCEKEFKDIDYIQIRPIETMINDKPYIGFDINVIQNQLKKIRERDNKINVIISDKWDLIFGEREFGFTKCYCAPFIGVIDAYGDYQLCCHVCKKEEYKICNVFETTPEQFWVQRRAVFEKLGPALGLNPAVCPLGCRGSNINRVLEGVVQKGDHDLFL